MCVEALVHRHRLVSKRISTGKMKEVTGWHAFHLKMLESLEKVRLTFGNMKAVKGVFLGKAISMLQGG